MGRWHIIEVEEDGVFTNVFHPHQCPWSIDYHPRTVTENGKLLSEAFYMQRYACDVAAHQTNVGNDGFPTEPGWYRLKIEHVKLRGFDWVEYDTDIEWEPIQAGDFNAPLSA